MAHPTRMPDKIANVMAGTGRPGALASFAVLRSGYDEEHNADHHQKDQRVKRREQDAREDGILAIALGP
jgi:hypothetical protein